MQFNIQLAQIMNARVQAAAGSFSSYPRRSHIWAHESGWHWLFWRFAGFDRWINRRLPRAGYNRPAGLLFAAQAPQPVFVLKIVKAVRQDFGAMIHQLPVSKIVATQLVQIVGKWIGCIKQCLVYGIAGIHGVAFHVDYFCLWQCQMDQPQVKIIEG